MSRRRRNTAHQLALRADMEQRLESLAPLSSEHRELLSTDGFIRYYRRMCDLYPTQVEAYERLEEYYQNIFGSRRYVDIRSLHLAISRRRRKEFL